MNLAQNYNLKFFLTVVSIFLVTISVNQGFYANLFSVVFCILCSFSHYKFNLFRIVSVIAILTLCIILYFLDNKAISYDETTILTVIYFILFIFLIFTGGNLDNISLMHSLKYVLLFLFSLHIIQFFSFIIFDYYIDFSHIFFGNESRYGSNLINFPRFTNIYEEPSTYSSVIILLGSIYYILSKKVLIPNIAFFLSISTLSLAGVLIASMALIVINFNKYISILLIIFTIFLLSIYYEHFPYGPVFIRYSLFQNIIDIEGGVALFGSGFLGHNIELSILSNPDLSKGRVASLNDLGSFVFIYIKFGFLGLLLQLFFLFKFFKTRNLPLVLIVLFGKLSILHPLYIILLSKNYAKS